jgi:hypothetical protein
VGRHGARASGTGVDLGAGSAVVELAVQRGSETGLG